MATCALGRHVFSRAESLGGTQFLNEREMAARDPNLLFDFAQQADIAQFAAMDDRVMGGTSESGMVSLRGHAAFLGRLECEGGGFASVRADARGRWSLANSRGVRIRCRGDGHVFKLTVRMDGSRLDTVGYQCDFSPPNGGDGWADVDIEWQRCTPSWRGRIVPNAERLVGERICSFGLMISRWDDHGVPLPGAGSGPFQLDIRSVEVLRAHES